MASDPTKGSTPRGPSSRSRDQTIRVAIAIGVVVAVVLLVVFLSGAITPSSPGGSPGPGGAYLTFQQAEAKGQGAVTGTAGGPWSAVLGIGVSTPHSSIVPALNLTDLPDLSDCTVTWTGGSAPNVTLPATPSTAAPGTASFWIVGFVNSSANLRLAIVASGNASVLATVAGSRCTEVLAYAQPLAEAVVVDSPAVATNVSAAGAAAWLGQHDNVTESWEVLPGAALGPITTPPTWHAYYTTCSVGAGGPAQGAEFTANITAATGYVTAHSNGTVACGSGLGALVTDPTPLSPPAARQTI